MKTEREHNDPRKAPKGRKRFGIERRYLGEPRGFRAWWNGEWHEWGWYHTKKAREDALRTHRSKGGHRFPSWLDYDDFEYRECER